MKRDAVRVLAAAALAAVVLTGCSSASDEGATADTEPAAGRSEPSSADKAVTRGDTVGAAGSACVMPIAFDIAADWRPKAVTPVPGSEIDELLAKQGPVTLVCEIDAKPAGQIGYLRVWKGDASDSTARQVLEAFVAAEQGVDGTKTTYYEETGAGALPAVEVGYTVHNELMDESKKERAFAVTTPGGPVVVHLGGLDSQEHEEMLPAYELARKSVRLG